MWDTKIRRERLKKSKPARDGDWVDVLLVLITLGVVSYGMVRVVSMFV